MHSNGVSVVFNHRTNAAALSVVLVFDAPSLQRFSWLLVDDFKLYLVAAIPSMLMLFTLLIGWV